MRGAKPRRGGVFSLVSVTPLLLPLSCGGQQGTTATDSCAPGIGLGSPPCACVSWANYIQPAPCCCQGQGCVSLQPNLSTVPARATVRVGQRFVVRSGIVGTPEGCNQGNWNRQPTWRSTDSTVLKFESAQLDSFSVGQFLAVAPGVATIVVDDMRSPSGQTERIALAACSPDWYECSSRVPIDVVVVP